MVAPPIHYPRYRGLRFEEDKALENLLSGVTVPNAQGQPLQVAVIYRMPDREEVRTTYPYFLIDFLGIFPRTNESHMGRGVYGMEPYTGNRLPNDGWTVGPYPIPITLRYQVSVASRVQQHDVILNDLCATTFFPIRFGQLVTPSGTVRRLDFEGMSPQDRMAANNQKLYMKIWSIAVSAEIMLPMDTGTPATRINVEVVDTDDGHVDASFNA